MTMFTLNQIRQYQLLALPNPPVFYNTSFIQGPFQIQIANYPEISVIFPQSTIRAIMDSLPVELIARIAFFACTDGGFTGASLSIVSKRIRNATHCARFLSIFLSSPEHFAEFLNTYLAQRHRIPEVIPQVRHLFLSLLPIEGEPIYRFPPLHPPLFLREYDRYLHRLGALGEEYGATVCALVQTLAPALESFTFVRREWNHVPQLHCAFPRLRELTLVDGAPEFLRIADVPQGRVPLFPALERLHTVECFYARPVDLRQWAPHAPALTHVRISGLHFRDCSTVWSLRDVSGGTSPSFFDRPASTRSAEVCPMQTQMQPEV